jgi:DNA invertase Pin-like site-specific DNA recombinase
MKGLHHLCNIASSGQTIYVYDVSRFSRNAHHALNILESLNNRKISVHSVKENLTYKDVWSRNQFRIQLSAANFMSDICSEKVKTSICYRRARGDYIGSTPYGFSTSVDLTTRVRSKVPNEEEMKVIDLIRSYHNDKLSPSVICENLNSQEIKCRKRDFTASTVKRIIKRFKNDLCISYQAIKKSSRVKTVKPY